MERKSQGGSNERVGHQAAPLAQCLHFISQMTLDVPMMVPILLLRLLSQGQSATHKGTGDEEWL